MMMAAVAQADDIVIVLHGGGAPFSSSDKQVFEQLTSNYTFVFPEAPLTDKLWLPDVDKSGPSTEGTDVAAQSVQKIDAVVQEYGDDVKGIIGYSQGATMATVYMAHKMDGGNANVFEFAVFIKGYINQHEGDHKGLRELVERNRYFGNVPALVVSGAYDLNFKDLTKEANEFFCPSTYIEEQYGSHYPVLDVDTINDLATFIEDHSSMTCSMVPDIGQPPPPPPSPVVPGIGQPPPPPKPKPKPKKCTQLCCKAMQASCMACSQCMTVEEYCTSLGDKATAMLGCCTAVEKEIAARGCATDPYDSKCKADEKRCEKGNIWKKEDVVDRIENKADYADKPKPKEPLKCLAKGKWTDECNIDDNKEAEFEKRRRAAWDDMRHQDNKIRLKPGEAIDIEPEDVMLPIGLDKKRFTRMRCRVPRERTDDRDRCDIVTNDLEEDETMVEVVDVKDEGDLVTVCTDNGFGPKPTFKFEKKSMGAGEDYAITCCLDDECRHSTPNKKLGKRGIAQQACGTKITVVTGSVAFTAQNVGGCPNVGSPPMCKTPFMSQGEDAPDGSYVEWCQLPKYLVLSGPLGQMRTNTFVNIKEEDEPDSMTCDGIEFYNFYNVNDYTTVLTFEVATQKWDMKYQGVAHTTFRYSSGNDPESETGPTRFGFGMPMDTVQCPKNILECYSEHQQVSDEGCFCECKPLTPTYVKLTMDTVADYERAIRHEMELGEIVSEVPVYAENPGGDEVEIATAASESHMRDDQAIEFRVGGTELSLQMLTWQFSDQEVVEVDVHVEACGQGLAVAAVGSGSGSGGGGEVQKQRIEFRKGQRTVSVQLGGAGTSEMPALAGYDGFSIAALSAGSTDGCVVCEPVEEKHKQQVALSLVADQIKKKGRLVPETRNLTELLNATVSEDIWVPSNLKLFRQNATIDGDLHTGTRKCEANACTADVARDVTITELFALGSTLQEGLEPINIEVAPSGAKIAVTGATTPLTDAALVEGAAEFAEKVWQMDRDSLVPIHRACTDDSDKICSFVTDALSDEEVEGPPVAAGISTECYNRKLVAAMGQGDAKYMQHVDDDLLTVSQFSSWDLEDAEYGNDTALECAESIVNGTCTADTMEQCSACVAYDSSFENDYFKCDSSVDSSSALEVQALKASSLKAKTLNLHINCNLASSTDHCSKLTSQQQCRAQNYVCEWKNENGANKCALRPNVPQMVGRSNAPRLCAKPADVQKMTDALSTPFIKCKPTTGGSLNTHVKELWAAVNSAGTKTSKIQSALYKFSMKDNTKWKNANTQCECVDHWSKRNNIKDDDVISTENCNMWNFEEGHSVKKWHKAPHPFAKSYRYCPGYTTQEACERDRTCTFDGAQDPQCKAKNDHIQNPFYKYTVETRPQDQDRKKYPYCFDGAWTDYPVNRNYDEDDDDIIMTTVNKKKLYGSKPDEGSQVPYTCDFCHDGTTTIPDFGSIKTYGALVKGFPRHVVPAEYDDKLKNPAKYCSQFTAEADCNTPIKQDQVAKVCKWDAGACKLAGTVNPEVYKLIYMKLYDGLQKQYTCSPNEIANGKCSHYGCAFTHWQPGRTHANDRDFLVATRLDTLDKVSTGGVGRYDEPGQGFSGDLYNTQNDENYPATVFYRAPYLKDGTGDEVFEFNQREMLNSNTAAERLGCPIKKTVATSFGGIRQDVYCHTPGLATGAAGPGAGSLFYTMKYFYESKGKEDDLKKEDWKYRLMNVPGVNTGYDCRFTHAWKEQWMSDCAAVHRANGCKAPCEWNADPGVCTHKAEDIPGNQKADGSLKADALSSEAYMTRKVNRVSNLFVGENTKTHAPLNVVIDNSDLEKVHANMDDNGHDFTTSTDRKGYMYTKIAGPKIKEYYFTDADGEEVVELVCDQYGEHCVSPLEHFHEEAETAVRVTCMFEEAKSYAGNTNQAALVELTKQRCKCLMAAPVPVVYKRAETGSFYPFEEDYHLVVNGVGADLIEVSCQQRIANRLGGGDAIYETSYNEDKTICTGGAATASSTEAPTSTDAPSSSHAHVGQCGKITHGDKFTVDNKCLQDDWTGECEVTCETEGHTSGPYRCDYSADGGAVNADDVACQQPAAPSGGGGGGGGGVSAAAGGDSGGGGVSLGAIIGGAVGAVVAIAAAVYGVLRTEWYQSRGNGFDQPPSYWSLFTGGADTVQVKQVRKMDLL